MVTILSIVLGFSIGILIGYFLLRKYGSMLLKALDKIFDNIS